MTTLGYLVPEWPAQTHAFFYREVMALRELDNRVHLFSTRKPPADACRHAFGPWARSETYYLFPPHASRAAGLLSRRPDRARAAMAYVRSLSDDGLKERLQSYGLILCAADLVARAQELRIAHLHVHSCATAAHLAAIAHALGGPSYSITVHGDLPIYGQDHAQKMRHAAFVNAVTRPLQKQVMEEAGLPEARVPVITMGVDSDRFRPASDGRAPSAGSLRLVTVARLNAMKGHAYVFEAMQAARAKGLDIRYTIAGAGEQREALEARVRALGLTPWVTFVGSLGEPEVLLLLQRADAFVLASEGLGEAAPVSVMEAMACATPAIVSRIGGTSDMIRDDHDGMLFEQRDVAALTSAIVRLANDLDLRKRLGEAARTKAEAEFDYRALAKRLDAEIRSAVQAAEI
jgi:glycosyltransferase involved in cell wall biosynthesis